LRLEEIARNAATRAHIEMLFDQAGWHILGKLADPKRRLAFADSPNFMRAVPASALGGMRCSRVFRAPYL
jgi:hypothetical protein